MYLVAIDAHSKWIEAFNTTSATSSALIEELQPLFACFGLPETVVTDNGTCFVSNEFEDFLASNGISDRIRQTYTHSLSTSNGINEALTEVNRQVIQYRARKRGGVSIRRVGHV